MTCGMCDGPMRSFEDRLGCLVSADDVACDDTPLVGCRRSICRWVCRSIEVVCITIWFVTEHGSTTLSF